jgi:hypothetical protein
MAKVFTSIRLTEEAAADLRRYTGERMAEEPNGRVSMSEALMEALTIARDFAKGKIVCPEMEGWRLVERSGEGEHGPEHDGEALWEPCAVAVCGEEWRRGASGWYAVSGIERIL